jgi:HK97 family phage major capsid protein
MYSKFLTNDYKKACWVCHPSYLPELIMMTNKSEAGGTTAGFLVWLNPAPSGDGGPASLLPPAMFLGIPLYVTEKLPALSATSVGGMALIDFSKYLLGDRMQIQIEASPYPNFVTNQMTWRVIARWDGQPELSAPITLADGVYQVSPYVLHAA